MEWVKTAKAGDKVVFVKEHGLSATSAAPRLKDRGVYTIREVTSAVRATGELQIGLRLVEITLETMMSNVGPWEKDFDHRCFRPIEPRKTDISVFTDMLKTTKEVMPLDAG